MFYMKALAIAFAIAIPISGLTMVISEKIGDISGRLFLGPNQTGVCERNYLVISAVQGSIRLFFVGYL
jgi:hypothetical protein